MVNNQTTDTDDAALVREVLTYLSSSGDKGSYIAILAQQGVDALTRLIAERDRWEQQTQTFARERDEACADRAVMRGERDELLGYLKRRQEEANAMRNSYEELEAERDALKSDIATYVALSAEQATEIEALKAANAWRFDMNDVPNDRPFMVGKRGSKLQAMAVWSGAAFRHARHYAHGGFAV